MIGYCGVDSGTIMIADPCYLIDKGWGEKDYEKEVVGMKGMTRQIKNNIGAEKGVLSSTGIGDGCYPVYAEIVNEGEWGKRVKSLTIKFL